MKIYQETYLSDVVAKNYDVDRMQLFVCGLFIWEKLCICAALSPHHFFLRSIIQNPQKNRPPDSAIRQLMINGTKDPVISYK